MPNSDARPSLKHLFLLSIVLLLSAPITAAESLMRIEGVVQDPFGTAVVGAQVTCKKSGAKKDEFLKTVSHYSGAFTFELTEPGSYNIDATADGYVEPNVILEGYRGLVRVAKVQEGGKPTVRRVRLLLYREAVVRGRLVEIENDVKKPVVKQTVGMVVTRFYEGQLTLSSLDASAVTDSKGTFVIEKLPPGDYYVQVAPTANETAKAGTAEKPVKVAERPRVYRRTYWPENAESVYGRPFRVDSGADVNVGE
ncbi:MAG: carboxypeptidase regulatory-like domain-containing protein, partial [Acidobacteriales bacterium]|nr:carboxypeptidase regulatory-like domain-containing protein [Terriglobales bacterium]